MIINAGVSPPRLSTLVLSPAALGFYMGTITAGFMLGSFLSGRVRTRGITIWRDCFRWCGQRADHAEQQCRCVVSTAQAGGQCRWIGGALTVGIGAVLTSITGVLLTQENGAYQLLGMMLFCSVIHSIFTQPIL